MGMCICGVCVAKKRGGDRVSRRKASPSWSAPLVRSLARWLAYTKAEDVLCCQGAVYCSAVTTYLSS